MSPDKREATGCVEQEKMWRRGKYSCEKLVCALSL